MATHCVNLHKLNLISRDKWVRRDRGCAGYCIPNGKRDWKQDGLAISFDCYAPEKFFVGVDLRSAAFERLWGLFGPLQYPGNRLADVLHMGRCNLVVPLPNIG